MRLYDLLRIVWTWAYWRRPAEERSAYAGILPAVADPSYRQEVATVQETIAQAIARESREEGREEGELLALRRTLQRLLTRRFDPLPAAVVQRIEETTDVERLNAAIDAVATISSPEDVQL